MPWLAGMAPDGHGVWPGWCRRHGTSAEVNPDDDNYLSWQEAICGTDLTIGQTTTSAFFRVEVSLP
ncbi:hypothetical protein SCARR_02789 [Pontiella sulfatireligans]|uniref:Uncharacterized protein n=1 Tax=Pontiella sulfatireligans TaxID=2750658 RepID=A0A6C2UKF7_9BACT|nr:hypothetical protein SCARR_02789 [Pontiella sulfatireligans]